MLSSGYQPPPIVPPIVAKTYSKALELWSGLSGQTFSGSAVGMLIDVFNKIQSVLMLLFGILFNSAVSFIWLGVLTTELIPPPFTVFKVLLVIVAGFAQLILVLYLIKSVASVISSYVQGARFLGG